MNRRRAQLLIFSCSFLLAFLLQLAPLPTTFLPFKPYWVALVMIYWAIEAPERVGLGFAWDLRQQQPYRNSEYDQGPRSDRQTEREPGHESCARRRPFGRVRPSG